MSDCAYLTLRVYDCPAEQARVVLDVLADYGVGLEYADKDPGVLHTAEKYVDDEATLGTEDRLATALIEAAPQCAFRVWQEPKYDSDGQLVMYHPDLGRFDCGCNAFGEPHITIDIVDSALARCMELVPDAAAGHLASELHWRLGVPWAGAFDRCVGRVIMPSGAQVPVGQRPAQQPTSKDPS